MAPLSTREGERHLFGEPAPRRALAAVVLGVLGLASTAFLVGLDVGLYGFAAGWLVIAMGIALFAGTFRAGLLPTVGCLWVISVWWFVFPPLVGYLTGAWSTASRYTHPRLVGVAYTSARAELLGGLDYGVRVGLVFGVIVGTIAYLVGIGIGRVNSRFQ